MVYNQFRIGVLIRVILLGATVTFLMYLLEGQTKIISAIIVGIVNVAILFELFRYVERTNRKLTRFLESIRYSDFISGFTVDNKLGKSFQELNDAFNQVIEAFRQTRSEKEEHWQYLNTVVQHVGTGLLSFDQEGNIELINNKAKQFLNSPQIRNIHELENTMPDLVNLLQRLKPGGNQLYRPNAHIHLVIQATELKLRGEIYKLVSLQNIQSELQQKEIEAWQNLTKVLRHEIMNSITPIASLSSTLNDILIEDLIHKNDRIEINEDTIDDLEEGLNTIRNRTTGLIRFVDAYRDYTNIPEPKLENIQLKELLDHVAQLEKIEIRKAKVEFITTTDPEDLGILADEELIQMVLINLVKNAIEAVKGKPSPKVELIGKIINENQPVIEVIDNGEGIVPEAIERIFMPFYTTKTSGSGIGLALSRQIMQLHNGALTVESEQDVNTVFTLRF